MKKNRLNNELIELYVESIGLQGVAIAKKDGLVYFVKGAVPEDKVMARIMKKKRNYVDTYIENIVESSKWRVEPLCEHFGDCGGCTWQNLIYDRQLKWKRNNIIDAFQRIGGMDILNFKPIIPSQKIYNYRNKMEFSFGASRWLTNKEINHNIEIKNKNFALGMHVSGRFDKVIDVDNCFIQNEIGNEILNEVRTNATENSISAYHQREHTGFLKNLIIRSSLANNEIMVILLTKAIRSQKEQNFIDWFLDSIPAQYRVVTNTVHAINDTVSPVALGEINKVNGKGYITENILDVEFQISPFSFFQTNSYQLNRFIEEILNCTENRKDKLLWDLYCGTGSISLPAAKYFKKVIGIELSSTSIEDAKNNALINRLDNVEFFCYDLHKKNISDLLDSLPKPDVIIIDPPRAGAHKYLIDSILRYQPEELIYVSCNPATQARDCKLLSEKYRLVSILPVDMFPHTFHIESIGKLELINNK